MSNALITTTAGLTPEGSLSRYLAEIRKFPMLETVSYTHLTLPTKA